MQSSSVCPHPHSVPLQLTFVCLHLHSPSVFLVCLQPLCGQVSPGAVKKDKPLNVWIDGPPPKWPPPGTGPAAVEVRQVGTEPVQWEYHQCVVCRQDAKRGRSLVICRCAAPPCQLAFCATCATRIAPVPLHRPNAHQCVCAAFVSALSMMNTKGWSSMKT